MFWIVDHVKYGFETVWIYPVKLRGFEGSLSEKKVRFFWRLKSGRRPGPLSIHTYSKLKAYQLRNKQPFLKKTTKKILDVPGLSLKGLGKGKKKFCKRKFCENLQESGGQLVKVAPPLENQVS